VGTGMVPAVNKNGVIPIIQGQMGEKGSEE
jgi:hypothetical protein